MLKWKKSLNYYKLALSRLTVALEKGELNELEQDGVIQRFEFTFETAWKLLKAYAEAMGFNDTASPKEVIKKAFAMKIIENGELWLTMLSDRNVLTHKYSQEESRIVFNRIKEQYVPELTRLNHTLHNKD